MAELPSYPESTDGAGPRPDSAAVRRGPGWVVVSGVVLAVVVVAALVALHLTGVLGPGASS